MSNNAVSAGEALLSILRTHIDQVAGGAGTDEDAMERLDRDLWEAVSAYGDALDELFEEAEEPDEAASADELTFTVRSRHDYTVVDEKAFLTTEGGIGAAVGELLKRAGEAKLIPALDIPSLEAGSGLVTVHLNGEPLEAADFDDAEEPTDLLLVAPGEVLVTVLEQPVFDSRTEAEAAAKRQR